MAAGDGPEFIFTGRLEHGDEDLYLVQVFADVVEIASRADEHDRWSIPMVFTRDKSREIHEEEERR